MHEKSTADVEWKECVDAALSILHEHVDALAELIDKLSESKTETAPIIAQYVHAVGLSCKSFEILVQHNCVRDGWVACRTAYLTILNACYTCSIGPEAANKAFRHAMQRAYRDLDQQVKLANTKAVLRYEGDISLEKHPDVLKANQEYTTKKGREIKSWTTDGPESQLKAVEEKYGAETVAPLLLTHLAHYRHASESAHGTIFGYLWFCGQTVPNERPMTAKDVGDHFRSLALVAGSSIIESVHCLIKLVSQEFNLGDSVIIKSKMLVSRLSQILERVPRKRA